MRRLARLGIAILVVAAVAAVASAQKKKGKQAASRERPATIDIRAPKGLKPVKVPKGAPAAPPAERWWEQATPCPAGATLESTSHGVTRHACVDAQGRPHGPFTELEADGTFLADGWYRHGVKHGLSRLAHAGNVYEERMHVDGEWHGDAIESGSKGTYRKGKRHGRWTVRADGGGEQHGYYVDGERQGTWLTVIRHRGEDLVVARATYKRGAVQGEVVWWTEAGALLATVKADWSGRRWQFYSGDKRTLTATCTGDALTYVVHQRGKNKVTCGFDPDTGERTHEEMSSGRGGCPDTAEQLAARALCSGDLLDPLELAREMRLAGMY